MPPPHPPTPPFSGVNYNRRARGSADPLPLFPMITPGAERRGIPVARTREGNLRPSRGSGVPVLSEARKLPSDETERVGKTEPFNLPLATIGLHLSDRPFPHCGSEIKLLSNAPARPAWRRGPRSRSAGQDDAIQASGG